MKRVLIVILILIATMSTALASDSQWVEIGRADGMTAKMDTTNYMAYGTKDNMVVNCVIWYDFDDGFIMIQHTDIEIKTYKYRVTNRISKGTGHGVREDNLIKEGWKEPTRGSFEYMVLQNAVKWGNDNMDKVKML